MPRSRPPGRWRRAHHRVRHSLRQSLRLRLILVFLLLALFMTVAFLGGMQKALGAGWRDAARPLLADYVDRLVADLGSPPSTARAEALVQRLPITLRISGPQVNWASDPAPEPQPQSPLARPGRWAGADEATLLQRTTADGHRVAFGLSTARWQHQPRRIGWITLAVLLLLTAVAYGYVRRLLRPLDDIRAGARRFGGGDFARPIPVRRRDELGTLAADVNTMAQAIHQMLESQRGLLLAISHELRSPLTRARLNTELLPEGEDTRPLRDALLRDLAGMRDLINDLLESERLGAGHGALHPEPTDLAVLVREVAASLPQTAHAVDLQIAQPLPLLRLDRVRIRLLVRNLLDNALRHGAGALQEPQLRLQVEAAGVVMSVRDHGPGVPDDALPHLAEPFYRPDASRERATGGVGLGLYLCRLVVLAHGGQWDVRNAGPGLEVLVTLPTGEPRAGSWRVEASAGSSG